MNLAPRFRLATLLAVGSTGAVGGHVLGYWVAHPHSHERDAVLEASGHGYMEMAVAVALVAGLMGLLGQFAMGLLDRSSSSESALGGRRWRTWATLAFIQTLVFVAVEVSERMLNGMDALAVFDEPAFWLGLPLQSAIAGLGALVLTVVKKVGAAIRLRSCKPSTERALTLTVTPTSSAPSLSWFGFTFSLRAPPLTS